ncbi:hypothetical protein [Paraburkholderia unamae]|uniref:hypothetical protein n=1 Tax=Paraburkholderia unamae TaxID=219649 RepID=UPI003CC56B39
MKHLNAPRTLLVSAANVVAVMAFVVAGVVRWPETSVMLAGAIAGGYGGALVGRRARPDIVRAITRDRHDWHHAGVFCKDIWTDAQALMGESHAVRFARYVRISCDHG